MKEGLLNTHHFTPTHYHNTLGAHEPVLHILPGDTIVTTTVDAMAYDAQGQQVTHGPNPQTGPFYVEGAERGDTIVLQLDHLTPNRPTGSGNLLLAPNVVDPGWVAKLPWEFARQE